MRVGGGERNIVCSTCCPYNILWIGLGAGGRCAAFECPTVRSWAIGAGAGEIDLRVSANAVVLDGERRHRWIANWRRVFQAEGMNVVGAPVARAVGQYCSRRTGQRIGTVGKSLSIAILVNHGQGITTRRQTNIGIDL